MRHRTLVLLCASLALIALASVMVGCGSSSSGPKIRLVNANPDEGSLDLLVDTKSAITGVGYGAASSYVGIATGSRQLQVVPTGTTTVLFDRTDTFSSGTNMTLLSLNLSFDISSLLLTDDNTAPASGNFKLRIVNASPGMGAQDVYVVTAGSGIDSVAPTFASQAFGSVAGYLTLTAGDYEIFFTAPNTKDVNLDSGSITFASGQVRTLLGLNNPSGGFESTELTDAN
jgi:hypothetical protein